MTAPVQSNAVYLSRRTSRRGCGCVGAPDKRLSLCVIPNMIEIEFEPPEISTCECCGKDTVRLTRFVLKDGTAHAVYYAQYSKGHETDRISGIIGLGDWGELAGPADRLAFPFEIWVKDGNFNVGLVAAADSPWHDVKFLGRVLNRDEALLHPWHKEAFHITDHMVAEDPEIVAFFSANDA